MISRAFNMSIIAAAALLVACGGGGSSSTPALSGAPSVEPALDAAKAFLTKFDALLATAIPTPGAVNMSLSDGCSLGDGWTKAYVVADFDANLPQAVASRQWMVGSTRTNVAVAGDRTSANTDGTSRREIDVTYAVNYIDGTKQESATQTIISGSSSGAKLPDGTACTTPDSKTDWRFYGNRKIVATFVSASNERRERTLLATGLDKSPQVVYSKYITLGVQDPAKVATYATITGPGLGFTTVGSPGTLKLLSVRVLRDAPELAGKLGNYVDGFDTDSFHVCSNAAATNSAPADTADCVAGAWGNSWGVYNSPSGSDLDTVFATINITKAAVYTINVYGDDGWKAVNGQAGKAPIATYTSTLDNLPLSAAAMAGMGVTADLFARIATSTKTPAELATAIRTKAAISTGLTWTMPGAMPDTRATALSYVGTYEEGQANAMGAAWPASRKFDSSFPGPLAASSTVNIPAPAAALVVPRYAEFSLGYVNRNGNNIRSIYTFEQ